MVEIERILVEDDRVAAEDLAVARLSCAAEIAAPHGSAAFARRARRCALLLASCARRAAIRELASLRKPSRAASSPASALEALAVIARSLGKLRIG
jgi:hypothetical protein